MSIFDFREVRKANILSCYGSTNDIIKSSDHHAHHLNHKYIRKEGDKYIYEEPKKDLDNIKKDIIFDLSKTQNMKSNLDQVLEVAQPKIDEMVENFKQSMLNKKEGKPASEFDIEMYELGITIDLMKAFGKYVKKTDSVSDVSIGKSKGVITISCVIGRDGKNNGMVTQMIIAGGYNIQCRHYRYITDTTLRLDGDNTAADPYIAKKAKLTKTAAIMEGIELENKYFNKDLDGYNTLKSKPINDVYDHNYLNDERTNWDNITESAKEYYKTKQEFEQYIKEEKEKVLNHHILRISEKRLNYIKKEHEKKLAKLQIKLDKL